jgi:hypothetical protein
MHDRRQFGRRSVCLHGWICVEGRPRIPCLVSDLSIVGARLDLDVPAWLPFRFRLVIDASRFAADCEIRHQRSGHLGVAFVTRETALMPKHNVTVDDVEPWKGMR